MNRGAGKVAVITGAGSGVGQACMKLFAAEGAKVVGVSRTQSNLDETLAAVKALPGEGKVVAADLGVSQRTVENHRASIMAKTDTKSLPALARMAMAAVNADRSNR